MILFNKKIQKRKKNIEGLDSIDSETIKLHNQDIEKHVGQKIKLFRQLRGLSQSDVAVHLGITFQQFQKYESGRNRIPIARLMKLAEIIGVNMSVFFENNVNVMFEDIMAKKGTRLQEEITPIEVSVPQKSNSISVGEESDEIADLVRSFKVIKDFAVRKQILSLVKSLSDESRSLN